VVQWLAGRGRSDRSAAPLVIAREDPAFSFKGEHAPGGVRLYITVERARALNVSFGVQMDGVKVPYHTDPSKYRWGRQERTINPGDRYPVEDSAYVQIPWWLGRWPHSDRRFRQRILWARYQDEKGRAWETLNPADEGAQMVGPRRVRARRPGGVPGDSASR